VVLKRPDVGWIVIVLVSREGEEVMEVSAKESTPAPPEVEVVPPVAEYVVLVSIEYVVVTVSTPVMPIAGLTRIVISAVSTAVTESVMVTWIVYVSGAVFAVTETMPVMESMVMPAGSTPPIRVMLKV
jgi:hypothetical protein